MAEPVLSRVQRNEIFAAIRRAELDPADFDWSQGSENDGGANETISHRPTGARLTFSHGTYGAGWWLNWAPKSSDGNHLEKADNWVAASARIRKWVAAVRGDHTAPDLWNEITKERVLGRATQQEDEYAKQFSPQELKQLEAALADIELYVITTQPVGGIL